MARTSMLTDSGSKIEQPQSNSKMGRVLGKLSPAGLSTQMSLEKTIEVAKAFRDTEHLKAKLLGSNQSAWDRLDTTKKQDALFTAIEASDVELLEILERFNVNFNTIKGTKADFAWGKYTTPLFASFPNFARGDLEKQAQVTQWLLDHGAELDSHSRMDWRNYDTIMRANPEVMEFLLSRGVKVVTPLQCVVMMQNRSSLQQLIDQGANIDPVPISIREWRMFNPSLSLLQMAVLKDCWATIPVLLQACERLDEPSRWKILDHRADNGETPLHSCARQTRPVGPRTLSRLLQLGADSAAQDKAGRQPLHLAVELPNKGVVERLLNEHVDVNQQDGQGFTPLHLAARRGDAFMVKQLLHAGASLESLTREGQTALDVALANASIRTKTTNGVETIEALLAHGARITSNVDSSEVLEAWKQKNGTAMKDIECTRQCHCLLMPPVFTGHVTGSDTKRKPSWLGKAVPKAKLGNGKSSQSSHAQDVGYEPSDDFSRGILGRGGWTNQGYEEGGSYVDSFHGEDEKDGSHGGYSGKDYGRSSILSKQGTDAKSNGTGGWGVG